MKKLWILLLLVGVWLVLGCSSTDSNSHVDDNSGAKNDNDSDLGTDKYITEEVDDTGTNSNEAPPEEDHESDSDTGSDSFTETDSDETDSNQDPPEEDHELDSDTGSDSFTETDSDVETKWPIYDDQILFECPPPDMQFSDLMRAYEPLRETLVIFGKQVWQIGRQWLDESRVLDCETTAPETSCKTASYTTDDGVAVEYRYLESFNELTPETYPNWTEQTDLLETLSITLPEGTESWTSLDLTYKKIHRDSDDDPYPRDTRESFTTQWTGSVNPAWPSDLSMTHELYLLMIDMYYEWSQAIENSNCTVSHTYPSDNILLSINENLYDIRRTINEGDFLFLNDTCVGETSRFEDWQIVGPCLSDDAEYY